MNYYNEHDPRAAAWLRELIKANLIAPGEVDERDIQDVLPRELVGYTQCHFFAGIGVWSYALRSAGWPDDRSVWTGSCPCQPFSQAGERNGFDDERHLWPAWFHLIRICKPDVVLGEQVANKGGLAWLDLVQNDLEAAAYVVGALDLCAAGVGAPHVRQRLFFVADAASERYDGRWAGEESGRPSKSERPCIARSLADPDGRDASTGRIQRSGQQRQFAQDGGAVDGLGDTNHPGPQGRGLFGAVGGRDGSGECAAGVPGPVNGFWADAEWIYCQDEKYRPTEPGVFPLAHGASGRVGRLRGYGNAIVAPLAEEFIRAYIEVNEGP